MAAASAGASGTFDQEAIYAADALGLVENDDGVVLGVERRDPIGRPLDGLPPDDAGGALFGAETINAGARPGETLYERADAQGSTMSVRNTSKLRVEKDGQPFANFLMLWRLDTEQYVRVPAPQVVECLNKRNSETGKKVFALKAPANGVKERPLRCPTADETGCGARFLNRAQQLNHFRQRHPALWEARAAENEAVKNDTQAAMVEQLRAQQDAMVGAMREQGQLLAAMTAALSRVTGTQAPEAAAVVGTLANGTANEEPPIPKRLHTRIDAIPRGPDPVNGSAPPSGRIGAAAH